MLVILRQMIIVDNSHKVSSSGAGDNYYLNLDGILFLGRNTLLRGCKLSVSELLVGA